MINVDADLFKDHVATLKDYGEIKILDFKKPESQHYHIRFTFDEPCGYFYISGDLGFLTAVRRGGMTYEGFTAYVNSPQYFEEKVMCHSRPFYEFDYDDARKDMPLKIYAESIKDYKFCISSYGKAWDICTECRNELNEWMKKRKEEREGAR